MLVLRVFLCFVFIITGVNVFALGAKKEPVVSTQGIEISDQIVKTVKPSAKQRKEQRKKKMDSNAYIKRKKKIRGLDIEKRVKQQELDFLQKRLEIKNNRLNEMNLENEVKGEKK